MPLPSLPAEAAQLDIPLGGREVCQNITNAEEAGAGEYLPPRNAEIRTAVRIKLRRHDTDFLAGVTHEINRLHGPIRPSASQMLEDIGPGVIFADDLGRIGEHQYLRRFKRRVLQKIRINHASMQGIARRDQHEHIRA